MTVRRNKTPNSSATPKGDIFKENSPIQSKIGLLWCVDMTVDVLMCWCVDVSMCRCVADVCWCVLMWVDAGRCELVCWCVLMCVDVLMWVDVCWCGYVGMWIDVCWCRRVWLECVDACWCVLNELMYWCIEQHINTIINKHNTITSTSTDQLISTFFLLVEMCWCVDVLMCWCAAVLMTLCWCVDDVLMCWCVDVWWFVYVEKNVNNSTEGPLEWPETQSINLQILARIISNCKWPFQITKSVCGEKRVQCLQLWRCGGKTAVFDECVVE